MKKTITTVFLLFTLFSTSVFAEVIYQDEADDGTALYQQHCARCHGKLEKTRIPDRSARRIASAIKNLGSMGKLKNLTPAQIGAISQVLQSEPEHLTNR